MPSVDPTALRQEANRLAELWRSVASVHIAGGQGCSCSVGGVLLMASDFELDIVECLLHDARKAKATDIATFVEAAAYRGPDSYSLSALLEALGDSSAGLRLSDAHLEFTVARLGKLLSSLDMAHRDTRPPPVFGRRF